MTAPVSDRRLALDWLRIAALGLLIFYHVGMFYVTWDFHVKSSRASEAIEPLMLALNPWRLLLLFVISGAATRFMADKIALGALFSSRSARLLPPLLLAVFVIVPPQTYFEVVERFGFAGGWADFYGKYLTASGGWRYPDGGTLITPTYNHMWFVVYLFVYTALLIALLPLLRRAPRWLAKLAEGPWLLLLPWAFLFAARIALAPMFGQTHALIDDWYLHAIYFGGFLYGFGIAKHAPFFESCARMRWAAAGLAVFAYAVLMWARAIFVSGGATAPEWGALLAAGLREMQAWTAIVALIGFAHLHWRGDGPVRRYLTEAIFPFYIVHQTVIIVLGHYLDPLRLPVWLEASLIVGGTALSCALTFEIVRRAGFLRPWFGLKRLPKQAKSVAASGGEGHIRGEA